MGLIFLDELKVWNKQNGKKAPNTVRSNRHGFTWIPSYFF